jgi:putative tryptophan/tyrosine transport system substrate-binding protein
MNRRECITVLGGVASTPAWPLAARGQQTLPVIGFISSTPETAGAREAFARGLSAAGLVVGRDVAIEYRWAGGENERLPALAADLVRRQVTVIVAISDSAALAAKTATATIPIVFSAGNDPVEHGLVGSLSHPGANVTGVTNLNVELTSKRMEMLRELSPLITGVAALVNPIASNAADVSRNLDEAARSVGLQLQVFRASTAPEVESAFAALRAANATALIIGPDAFYNIQSAQLGALSARSRVAAIFQTREFVAAGGLASYAPDYRDSVRLVYQYVARILRGEKPAGLPVVQATKVTLIINMKTAKALGLTVPLSLLGRADEVIE